MWCIWFTNVGKLIWKRLKCRSSGRRRRRRRRGRKGKEAHHAPSPTGDRQSSCAALLGESEEKETAECSGHRSCFMAHYPRCKQPAPLHVRSCFNKAAVRGGGEWLISLCVIQSLAAIRPHIKAECAIWSHISIYILYIAYCVCWSMQWVHVRHTELIRSGRH